LLLSGALPWDAAAIGCAEEAEIKAAPPLLVGEVSPEALDHLLERPITVAVIIVVVVVVVGVTAEEAVCMLSLNTVDVDRVVEDVVRKVCLGRGVPVVELGRDPPEVRAVTACPTSAPCAC
jgi:hypothetical protein